MSQKYNYVGEAVARVDAKEIVTGGAVYLGDRVLPGMVHAKVVRSAHAHAKIVSIDRAAALALPGVLAVLTHEDAPDWRVGTPRLVPILDGKVRYVGDAVALVAALTEAAAEEAARLVKVSYEVLPHSLTMEKALAPGSSPLFEEFPDNEIPGGTPFFGPKSLTGVHYGNVEEGFLEADAVIEGTFGFRNLPNPLPPETPGAIVLWEQPNRATVYLSSQGPHQDKLTLYYSFGRNVEVRVIGGPCGGSYGSKFMSVQLVLQAAALSRATGRPVRLCLTKEEHLAAFTLRMESKIKAKVGMKRDGTVTGVSGEWQVGTGAYSFTTQAQVAVGCGEAQLVVRSSNWDLKTKIVATNRNPSGIVRGFGGQELKCALVPILTLAMEKLDIDPFDFFRRNFIRPGDGFYWRDGVRRAFRGIDYSASFDEGALAFGWKDKWKGWLKPTIAEGTKRIGVGIGVHGNVDVGESVSEAHVRLDPQGTVTIITCAVEHGTGQPSNFCKMAADILQVPVGSVRLSPPDTLTTPFDMGPVGSRGTYGMGSAVINGAEDAKAQLLGRAAKLLDCEPEELDTCDGEVFRRDGFGKRLKWAKAIGVEEGILGVGRFEPDYTQSNCMITFVEVEVDTATGKARLLSVVNSTDAGRIIDPPGLTNQLNGCLGSAGIDAALFEESAIDGRTGRIMNANMIDYKWRTFSDLPEMTHLVRETPMPTHRFGAVGVGEVATAPGPIAVWMAVSNAIGARLPEYPATPERILAVLKEVEG